VEVNALLGQAILLKPTVKRVLHKHPMFKKGVEPVGEDLLADAEVLTNLFESAHSEEDVAHDEQRPPLANNVQRLGDGAIHVVERCSLHNFHSSPLRELVCKATKGAEMTDIAEQNDSATGAAEWHKTSCILCESNCGIEVKVDGRQFVRIRGNKDHVESAGYTCEKALRLNHYQNHRARLTSPMRRRPDGTYEEIDWDTAIREVAQKLAWVRDTWGGDKIFRYGGGGLGNHLNGLYGASVLTALGSIYKATAISQEKTGEAFVEARLYGAHTRPEVAESEVIIFLGKNPWQSHGFPHARKTMQAIEKDPNRAMVVIDPKRTKSAEMADYHLRVRPGTDAFCLAAILGIMHRENLFNEEFIRDHVADVEPVLEVIGKVPVEDYAQRCGVSLELLTEVARRIGRAKSVGILEDLGIEMGPNSTLISWLHRLIWILRGSWAIPGGNHPHSSFGSLGGGSSESSSSDAKRPSSRPKVTPVTGARIIMGLIPCNTIPDEFLTDHPDRFRAFIVESGNPVHSMADSKKFREAMRSAEFSLVIDLAMTETARQADYVLPAATQYEKPEAVFFNFHFPHNAFYLRKPVFEPTPGTLTEAEISARLAEELGLYTLEELAPLVDAAHKGLAEFGVAFMTYMAQNPDKAKVGSLILYRTLGQALPEGLAPAAGLWFLAHGVANSYGKQLRRAGIDDSQMSLGDALFTKVLESDDGVVFTDHEYEEAWELARVNDKRIRINIPEMLELFEQLSSKPTTYASAEFPLILSAGERRSNTANGIYRDPAWRKNDHDGALAISPQDAQAYGLSDGDRVRITTAAGTAEPVVMIDEDMHEGHISLPNGYGLEFPDEKGEHFVHGIAPNELTSLDWKDEIAGTPWHKHVPARLERIAG